MTCELDLNGYCELRDPQKKPCLQFYCRHGLSLASQELCAATCDYAGGGAVAVLALR